VFRTIRNRYTLTIVYEVPSSRTGSLVSERQAGTGDDPVTIDATWGDAYSWSSALDHDLRIPLRCLDTITP
jgi:hypothetical protein